MGARLSSNQRLASAVGGHPAELSSPSQETPGCKNRRRPKLSQCKQQCSGGSPNPDLSYEYQTMRSIGRPALRSSTRWPYAGRTSDTVCSNLQRLAAAQRKKRTTTTATTAPTSNAWTAPRTCQSNTHVTKPARKMLSDLKTLFGIPITGK